MKIQIKSWTPSNANFERFYVTDIVTGEQVGFIQTNTSNKGYGNGTYAVHRAAKGDHSVDTVDRIMVAGDAPILQAVVELAKELHPAAKFDMHTVVESLDIQLHRMSINVPLFRASAAKKKAQKTLSFDVEPVALEVAA